MGHAHGPEATFPVRKEVDRLAASSAARTLCGQLGFDARSAEEVAIAVSELSSNIAKYGAPGEVRLSPHYDETHGVGVCITARDCGPPIENLATALLDGNDGSGNIEPENFFGRRGIGTGLGAVVRFSDVFDCLNDEHGKVIRIERYVARPARRRTSIRCPS